MNEAPIIPDQLLDDPATREADAQAVMDQFVSGKSLDPEVARRVLARATRITDELFRRFGELDVAVDLIRETRNEE